MTHIQPINTNLPHTQTSAPKTHAGLKVAAGITAINAGMYAINQAQARTYTRFLDGSELAAIKKTPWMFALMAGTALGTGALVDKLINNKRVKFAQETKNKAKNEILKNRNDANTTRNGNIYQKTNTAKKVWTPILAGTMTLTNLANVARIHKYMPIPKELMPTIIGAAATTGAIGGAIGGLVYGAITDYCANKTAQKYADKEALNTQA